MRRSSRLAKKKRVDYNADNYFDRVLGTLQRGWQRTVKTLEAKPVTKPKPPKGFKKKELFRKKPVKKPVVPKEIVRIKAKKREVIDLTQEEDDTPEVRIEKIRDRKVFKPLNKVATRRKISKKIFRCDLWGSFKVGSR